MLRFHVFGIRVSSYHFGHLSLAAKTINGKHFAEVLGEHFDGSEMEELIREVGLSCQT